MAHSIEFFFKTWNSTADFFRQSIELLLATIILAKKSSIHSMLTTDFIFQHQKFSKSSIESIIINQAQEIEKS